jgi:hypothetical protein
MDRLKWSQCRRVIDLSSASEHMIANSISIISMLAVLCGPAAVSAWPQAQRIGNAKNAVDAKAYLVLWRDPTDIPVRNLFYGSGGKEHVPRAPFSFKKEDLSGSSPKFVVDDGAGVKWKVKLGTEARPERDNG